MKTFLNNMSDFVAFVACFLGMIIVAIIGGAFMTVELISEKLKK